MTKPLSVFLCLVITGAFALCADASDEARLVGSSLNMKEEIASATDIVVGRIMGMEESSAAGLGADSYEGQVAVAEVIKGNVTGSVKVVFSVGERVRESVPFLDDAYIMIMEKDHIRKLLPATAENIAKVRALVGGRGGVK